MADSVASPDALTSIDSISGGVRGGSNEADTIRILKSAGTAAGCAQAEPQSGDGLDVQPTAKAKMLMRNK